MPRLRKPRKQAAVAETPNMFEGSPFGGSELPWTDPEPAPKEDDEPDYKAQIAALQQRLDTMHQEQMALLARPQFDLSAFRQNEPAQDELDLSSLPDPLNDPVEFSKSLIGHTQKMIDAAVQRDREARTQQDNQEAEAQRMWDEFAKQYPGLATRRDMVEFAATKVAESAAQRGFDTRAYINGPGGRFYADVAAYLQQNFGLEDEQEEDEGKGDGMTAARRSQARTFGGDDDGRTAGVFGGNRGAPYLPNRRTSDDEPGDMIKDLQERQRKSGFF